MKSILFILFSLIYFQFIQAQIQAQMSISTYKELIDQEKNSGTEYYKRVNKPIPPDLIAYYKKLKPEIIKIAKLYGIDAVTLVATPIAENTMNVQIDDDIQNFLVSSGLAPKGQLLGKK